MVRDPIAPLGLQVGFLERTPIDTYFSPGVFLLSISAACRLAVAGLVSRWRWHWAAAIEPKVGYRLDPAPPLGVLTVQDVLAVPDWGRPVRDRRTMGPGHLDGVRRSP